MQFVGSVSCTCPTGLLVLNHPSYNGIGSFGDFIMKNAHPEISVVKTTVLGCYCGKTFIVHEAQKRVQVLVADTVGCGDSFAAGIVLGYIQKQPLSTVLALSNAVGAATATSPGAGRNVASADTVRDLLSRQASSGSSSTGEKTLQKIVQGHLQAIVQTRRSSPFLQSSGVTSGICPYIPRWSSPAMSLKGQFSISHKLLVR